MHTDGRAQGKRGTKATHAFTPALASIFCRMNDTMCSMSTCSATMALFGSFRKQAAIRVGSRISLRLNSKEPEENASEMFRTKPEGSAIQQAFCQNQPNSSLRDKRSQRSQLTQSDQPHVKPDMLKIDVGALP